MFACPVCVYWAQNAAICAIAPMIPDCHHFYQVNNTEQNLLMTELAVLSPTKDVRSAPIPKIVKENCDEKHLSREGLCCSTNSTPYSGCAVSSRMRCCWPFARSGFSSKRRMRLRQSSGMVAGPTRCGNMYQWFAWSRCQWTRKNHRKRKHTKTLARYLRCTVRQI